MRKIPKLLLICIIAAMTLPASYAALAKVVSSTSDKSSTVTPSPLDSSALDVINANSIAISQQVLDKIKQSDPDNYEKNVTNYKNLLTELNVHDKFKQEIDRLLAADHKLPDLLVAYLFLYQSYGQLSDLEPMVANKESGKKWSAIFSEYANAHPVFAPRAFDSSYLEELMQTPNLNSDDIMIADRVSFAIGKPFEEIISIRLKSISWKAANADLGILYSADKLPRVQITAEQMNKYTAPGKLTEDQVAQAFVIANKAGKSADSVIEQIKAGYSEEAILAQAYSEKYE
ncbi:hypothetical protein [Cohnella cholangitidis]|uniref:Uncharacterized protein n=1 Tax=Cohnella cholangitidis TaxID=2598458 RepID=A0A7G5BZQ1_9BACL|nr:hypothetical protein [Cohnella cholangitidis]QMV42435.1 hypothetical protein FPL14_15440 [Cohnella cholangitidis]